MASTAKAPTLTPAIQITDHGNAGGGHGSRRDLNAREMKHARNLLATFAFGHHNCRELIRAPQDSEEPFIFPQNAVGLAFSDPPVKWWKIAETTKWLTNSERVSIFRIAGQ